ncbi:hypothetical protein NIES3275_43180 [Microchaete diplosiphon NIES-3275]|nr:hypothetical protein NIES3275_43180 [Microchaete diplosiphon NIES-3275]
MFTDYVLLRNNQVFITLKLKLGISNSWYYDSINAKTTST